MRAFAFPSPACGRGEGEGALAFFIVRRLGFFAKTYPRPCGFVPHPCGPVPFLCLPKEKEPKEKAPRQHRPPGILPCGCAKALRRFAECTSVYTSERARILRAPLRAFPTHLRRALRGPVWRHPAAEATAPAYRSYARFAKEQTIATTQCRDARVRAQPAPFAAPSIAGFAGSARRGAAMDRRDREAAQGLCCLSDPAKPRSAGQSDSHDANRTAASGA